MGLRGFGMRVQGLGFRVCALRLGFRVCGRLGGREGWMPS